MRLWLTTRSREKGARRRKWIEKTKKGEGRSIQVDLYSNQHLELTIGDTFLKPNQLVRNRKTDKEREKIAVI